MLLFRIVSDSTDDDLVSYNMGVDLVGAPWQLKREQTAPNSTASGSWREVTTTDLNDSQSTATLPTNTKEPLSDSSEWVRLYYSLNLLIMGRLSEQLNDLIKEMEESDRRLQELTERHLADTKKALNRLEEISQADWHSWGLRAPSTVPTSTNSTNE